MKNNCQRPNLLNLSKTVERQGFWNALNVHIKSINRLWEVNDYMCGENTAEALSLLYFATQK